MKAALISRLVACPALIAIGGRWSWVERPRSTLPAGVLNLIGPGREYTHEGHDGVDEPRVAFEIFGLVPEVVDALATALIAEMETVREIAGVRFWNGFLDSQRTMPPEDLAGDVRVFREIVDMSFNWEVI